jgi:perosamine synthetase
MALIPWSLPYIDDKEKELVNLAIDSTWLSMGPYVDEFERMLADIVGTKYCVSTSNGTTAIHLSFLSLGLNSKSVVAIPAYGFLAAANIATQMEIKIQFYDLDRNTMNIESSELSRLAELKVDAIILIQNYGNMNNMKQIEEWAADNKVILIEDAAESLGSKYGTRMSGSFGNVSTMSFHGAKTITTGEGGAVFTNNEELYAQLLLYRSHGVSKVRYKHELPGHNFRMSNLQGALGVAQLTKLDQVLQRKREIQERYFSKFENTAWKTLEILENSDPVLWAFPVWLKEENNVVLDLTIANLENNGIEVRRGFYSANRLSIYGEIGEFPISDAFSKGCLILPSYFKLTDEQIDLICRVVLEA